MLGSSVFGQIRRVFPLSEVRYSSSEFISRCKLGYIKSNRKIAKL